MKKKRLIVAVLATILAAALGAFCLNAASPPTPSPEQDFKVCEEGDGDGPGALIVCDGGNCGQCFTYNVVSNGFRKNYECLFTGKSDDKCSCGWVNFINIINIIC